MELGVLSTAHIATDYLLPALAGSEHRVGAIASRSADRAEAAAVEHGIERAYGSYDDLLADDAIDAVYVPLPNALQRSGRGRPPTRACTSSARSPWPSTPRRLPTASTTAPSATSR